MLTAPSWNVFQNLFANQYVSKKMELHTTRATLWIPIHATRANVPEAAKSALEFLAQLMCLT